MPICPVPSIELNLLILASNTPSALLLFIKVRGGALARARARAARYESVWIASRRGTRNTRRSRLSGGPKTAFHWYLSLTQPPTVRIHGSAAGGRERDIGPPNHNTTYA